VTGAHRAERVEQETPAALRPDVRAATAGDTRELGHTLAKLLRPGDLVLLSGDLGAGKTTFTRGIGQGLGVRGDITSPTFVIARVHPSHGDGPALVHVDAYRLGSLSEVDDLDLDAGLADSVTVVEWGEGLVEDLAPDRLEVRIDRPHGGEDPDGSLPDGDEPRTVCFTGYGPRWRGVALPVG
jgi:tRNA threonylcarbamoyladenosine biosynthesis protein TsaE